MRVLFNVLNFTFMYYVYITTNPNTTTLYIGVTNDIKRRMSEHKEQRGIWKHFAGRYYCYNHIYFEPYETANEAINREKELKDLTREKKFDLIKLKNPDLSFYKL